MERLTREEAIEAEKALAADPENVELRMRLLGFYALRWIGSPDDRATCAAHVYWMIEHRPEVDLSRCGPLFLFPWLPEFQEAKRRWLAAVAAQPSNVAIRKNAVTELFVHDPETAKQLLVDGIALGPVQYWHQALAGIHQMRARTAATAVERYELATLTIAECERGLACAEEAGARVDLHRSIARAAVETGDLSKARAAAQWILAEVQGPLEHPGAHPVHWAHVVLGKIALAADDVPRAAAELAASVSPDDDFGGFWASWPDLSLAAALLERGEREAVIRYLEAIEGRWSDYAESVRGFIECLGRGEAVDLDEPRRQQLEREEMITSALRAKFEARDPGAGSRRG